MIQIQKIEGLRELETALKRLREEFGVSTGGILIRGLRKGARLIRDDARRRVPHIPSGYIPKVVTGGRRGRRLREQRSSPAGRRSIIRSNIIEQPLPVKHRLAGGRPTVIVRVRNRGYTRTSSGAIRFNNPAAAWWYVEFGTSKRAAQPFLRPAFEAQKAAALQAFTASVRQEIEDLWVKNLKRAA